MAEQVNYYDAAFVSNPANFDYSGKRVFDLCFSSLLLIVAVPVFLICAAAILLGTGGPVFLSQERMGRGGRRFKMYKFRTMVRNAHLMRDQFLHLNVMSGPFFKAVNDPRVTPVGRVLRRFSLDELPQLINVLKGDMSIVGPRPMLPEEVRALQCKDVLVVRPGLTGLWQVSGRSLITDFNHKLALDRKYIELSNFKQDLWILLKTFRAVFRATGAF